MLLLPVQPGSEKLIEQNLKVLENKQEIKVETQKLLSTTTVILNNSVLVIQNILRTESKFRRLQT